MIEVFVVKDDVPLAKIEIRNESELSFGHSYADYTVKYAVERGASVGLHSRWVHAFPRKKYNVLALVRQALLTLEERELELEHDFDPDEAPFSPDVERKIRGALREISSGFSRLHRH